MAQQWRTLRKWLTLGLGIKRWLLMFAIGVMIISIAVAQLFVELIRQNVLPDVLDVALLRFMPPYMRVIVGLSIGLAALGLSIYALNRSVLAAFARPGRGSLLDQMYNHSRRQKGMKLVALGGGTGLPSVLRGLKAQTSNITAIVTVADDGGSSGKLRRELGVLPPGDLRNNIAALADDEDLMTQLFQYRFASGGLEGHSFGNLFITALAGITGSMDRALVEAGRVLAIQGRVLPSTVQDVTLAAEVRDGAKLRRVSGESSITAAGGIIERVFLMPENPRAYPESIRAILGAELIVIGPGSLYTSIIPNLLVGGITDAIKASGALCIYVCNVATQKGETEDFTVAEHVLALERHIGRGLFSIVLANNVYPTENAGPNTRYVQPAPSDSDIRQRYEIHDADLTDPQYPWRHSPTKLSRAILDILAERQNVNNAQTAAVMT